MAKAYRELELKGIIVSERGSGSFIQAPAPEPAARQKKASLKKLYDRLLAEAASSGLTDRGVSFRRGLATAKNPFPFSSSCI